MFEVTVILHALFIYSAVCVLYSKLCLIRQTHAYMNHETLPYSILALAFLKIGDF